MQMKSFAGNMILEDHLKKVMKRTGPQAWRPSNNKLLPKPLDSCFGDFPKDKKANQNTAVLKPEPLAAAETSIAAATNQKRKFTREP